MYNGNVQQNPLHMRRHLCQIIFEHFKKERIFPSLLGSRIWGQVLRDRNPGFLKSEIGPFSDFKRKSYLMDLKSAHSQESDFQESGEVDRFLKMGTHFQENPFSREIGLSGKWSLCYMVRLLATPMVFVWLLILVAVEQNLWPDHTPTRSTESSASSPSDSESNSKLSAMEVIDGNDGVLAAGIAVAVAATMQWFVCTPETSHVGTNRTDIVLKTSPQENAHLTIYQGASGRENRSHE